MESAFLCGLLHDVGMPIVMQSLCDLAAERSWGSVPPAAMEEAMSEFHCDSGLKLAQSWRLGPRISSAIRHHHDPAGAGSFQGEVLVTTLADALAYWAVDAQLGDQDFTTMNPDLQDLRLDQGDLTALLGSRRRVLESAQAFL